VGRPTKYTPEVQRRIVEALTAGASRRDAAHYAGIDARQFQRWLHRFAAFAAAVQEAEAGVAVRAALTVRQAFSDGDWRAASWWLERRRREDWGKVDTLEIEVRRAAERIAASTGADPDWLLKRAVEIAAASDRAEP
jgi:hypothetical protein